MFHECAQDLDKAKAIYNELLSINANDSHALKRLVAMERDCGHLNEAIDMLNQYLENNQ